jgi:hypothetical protein
LPPLVSLSQRGRLPQNPAPFLRRELLVRHLLSRVKEIRGVKELGRVERRGAKSRGALGIRPTRSIFGANNGLSGAFNGY